MSLSKYSVKHYRIVIQGNVTGLLCVLCCKEEAIWVQWRTYRTFRSERWNGFRMSRAITFQRAHGSFQHLSCEFTSGHQHKAEFHGVSGKIKKNWIHQAKYNWTYTFLRCFHWVVIKANKKCSRFLQTAEPHYWVNAAMTPPVRGRTGHQWQQKWH